MRSGEGFFKDLIQYNQVSGNDETVPVSLDITFGCGVKPTWDSGSFDGTLGFGPRSSVLSQLAASGKTKKFFCHCLDTIDGGGIFVVGNVLQPTLKTTTLLPDTLHYRVRLRSIIVAGSTFQLSNYTFAGDGNVTIIDSGTTLTYLPEAVYKTVIDAVFYDQPNAVFYDLQDFLCFHFSGRVDEKFPTITFYFDGDLALVVYPRDYIFNNGIDVHCMGLQNGITLDKDRKDMVILGDLVLSNKLVVYNFERQVIGWTDHDCSSGIKIKDEETGAIYDVLEHHISSVSVGGQQLRVSIL